MKRHLVFSIFLLLFTNHFCFAQKTAGTKVIEVLNADNIAYDQRLKDAQRLKGNVAFRHDGTLMYCDSAVLFSKENRFLAYGHIHVKRGDSLNMFGDSLHYRAKEKHCKIWGHIRLIEKDLNLTTDSIQFDAKESKCWYTGGALITSASSKTTLTSKKGLYLSSTKRMYFSENVVLQGEDYSLNADTLEYSTLSEIAYFHGPTVIRSAENTIYCESGWYDTKNENSFFTKRTFIHSKEYILRGDTIAFDRKTGAGNANGNIQITDTLNDYIINGGMANYNQNDNYFMVTDRPLLSKITSSEKDSVTIYDTLFVYADTMEAQQDTVKKQSWLNIYHRVKFYKSDLQGKCDSLFYNENDSLMRMFGEPIIWSDGNQLSAEKVEIKTADGKVFAAKLTNDCFVVSKADTVGFNQVKGKEITVYFKDEKMRKAVVIGNGQTVYFPGEKGKPYKGMNHTDCSDINVLFENDEPVQITFITKPDSVFYPMTKINPKDKFLKDFKWRQEDRPQSKKDLFPTN